MLMHHHLSQQHVDLSTITDSNQARAVEPTWDGYKSHCTTTTAKRAMFVSTNFTVNGIEKATKLNKKSPWRVQIKKLLPFHPRDLLSIKGLIERFLYEGHSLSLSLQFLPLFKSLTLSSRSKSIQFPKNSPNRSIVKIAWDRWKQREKEMDNIERKTKLKEVM